MNIISPIVAAISTPDVSKLKIINSPGASTIQNIMSVVFTIVGAVAVIFVVIGGIKYAASQGDPSATAKAKNTIIYAVVGLVVCIFATTIIQFAAGHI